MVIEGPMTAVLRVEAVAGGGVVTVVLEGVSTGLGPGISSRLFHILRPVLSGLCFLKRRAAAGCRGVGCAVEAASVCTRGAIRQAETFLGNSVLFAIASVNITRRGAAQLH
jgi:hypothetical protein